MNSGIAHSLSPEADEPIDLVYTWVDDSLPGYSQSLQEHARTAHDLNPNRTRDNLDVLRYSLRSVEQFAPWVRNVYLLTARPQVPPWLATDHSRLRLVHHDEIMAPEILPTFNSLAIIAHLHLLPGISRRFIYFNDDMLLGRPVLVGDFVNSDGRLRVFPRLSPTPPAERRFDTAQSGWNRSLAEVNHRLDGLFGQRRRRQHSHFPLWIDRDLWASLLELWPEATRVTRSSRFRETGNITMDYLYPQYLLETGGGVAVSLGKSYFEALYMPLENSLPLAMFLTGMARMIRPPFMTLNDNFGFNPNPGVVHHIRTFLQDYWPKPSSFERPASA